MPWIIPAIAATVAVAATVKSGIDANRAAGATDAYNQNVERLQSQYRRDVLQYQNTTFANDVDFYKRQIAWEKEEFAKNVTHVQDTIKAVDNDFFGKLATQMTKVVEQNMAEAIGIVDVNMQAHAATGSTDARVADSGTGGNNVALLRGDISRQAGAASNAITMNADMQRRQDTQDALALKAGRDTQLSQLNIPTFQPLQAPAPPAPVSPVNPSPPTQRIGTASIILNAASSGINMAVGVNSLIK